MALSDTKLRNLKPRAKPYTVADGGGLFIEVLPGGTKSWRLRYRLSGKQEKVSLGDYGTWSLSDARLWRYAAKSLAKRSVSPMALARGDAIPVDTAPIVREQAHEFVSKWCTRAAIRQKNADAARRASDTVETFAWVWFREVAEPANSNSRNIKRALEKDVIPAIGEKMVDEVTVADILAITDSIKARGADQMALQTRNMLKRLFAYAITRQKTRFNPAAAIEGKFIAVGCLLKLTRGFRPILTRVMGAQYT
tara:strand:+ start:279 stop:1034 length:756 start_codon:yes stop_codon:yes gene_type:complete